MQQTIKPLQNHLKVHQSLQCRKTSKISTTVLARASMSLQQVKASTLRFRLKSTKLLQLISLRILTRLSKRPNKPYSTSRKKRLKPRSRNKNSKEKKSCIHCQRTFLLLSKMQKSRFRMCKTRSWVKKCSKRYLDFLKRMRVSRRFRNV